MNRADYLHNLRSMSRAERRAQAWLWAKDAGGGLLLGGFFALALVHLDKVVAVGWAVADLVRGALP